MRDRIRIRKTGPKRWTVRIPAFGFGHSETIHKPSHRAALKLVDQRTRRPGSTDLGTETVWQASDRVNITPVWTPLNPPEFE